MSSLFKSLIQCGLCNKNYNIKNNNGTTEYICQTRKNKGKNYCGAEVVNEDFLIYVIKQNRSILKKEFNIKDIKNVIITDSIINVEFNDGYRINIEKNIIKFI